VAEDKIEVSTTGDFMMQDPTSGDEVQAYGTSTVTRTAWVEQQIAAGKLSSDTKVEAEEAPNPGADPAPVRGKAEQGEVRGASKSKNPSSVRSA